MLHQNITALVPNGLNNSVAHTLGVIPDLVFFACRCDEDFTLNATPYDENNVYVDNAGVGDTINIHVFKFDHSIETGSDCAVAPGPFGTRFQKITATLTGGGAEDTINHALGVVPDIVFVEGNYNRANVTSITRGDVSSSDFKITGAGAGGDVNFVLIKFHSIQCFESDDTSINLVTHSIQRSDGSGYVYYPNVLKFAPDIVLVSGDSTHKDCHIFGSGTAARFQCTQNHKDVSYYTIKIHSIFDS